MVRKCSDVHLRWKGKENAKRRKNKERILG